jgi:hypothetical protein
MRSLNYTDLLYLVIDMDIKAVEMQLKHKQKEINNARGIDVVEATNEDILRMHTRGR